MSTMRDHRSLSRRAILTLSVLVSLSVVMALYAAWIRTLLLERQQATAEIDRVQAEYLAVSALDRAAARLDADATYQGETWQIEPSKSRLPAAGSVEIRVEVVDGKPWARQIKVDAQYPQRGAHSVRQRQQKTIYLSEHGEAS